MNLQSIISELKINKINKKCFKYKIHFHFRSLRETNEQTLKILEYLECPQYLRKSLFPPNKHLEYVGKIQ